MDHDIPIHTHLSVRELAAIKRVARGETGTGVLAACDQDFTRAVLRRLAAAAESKRPNPPAESASQPKSDLDLRDLDEP
jgi:hypothetical protein